MEVSLRDTLTRAQVIREEILSILTYIMVPWPEYLDHVDLSIQVAEREGLHRGKNVARLSQEKVKV